MKKKILIISHNLTADSEFVISLMKSYSIKLVGGIDLALMELKINLGDYDLITTEEMNLELLKFNLPVALWFDSDSLSEYKKEHSLSGLLFFCKTKEQDHLLNCVNILFEKSSSLTYATRAFDSRLEGHVH